MVPLVSIARAAPKGWLAQLVERLLYTQTVSCSSHESSYFKQTKFVRSAPLGGTKGTEDFEPFLEIPTELVP